MIPATARRRFHRHTPWLFFHRDHPLGHERWNKPKRNYEEDESFGEQADRLHDILVLPDDDDEPGWPLTGAAGESAAGGGPLGGPSCCAGGTGKG